MSLDGRELPPAEAGAELALPAAEPAVLPEAGMRQRFLRAGWEFLHDLSVAVLFCFFLIAFVAQAFRVQGTSMEPLLLDGERIVVNKFVYRFRPIERGDVVVFWFPQNPSLSFVKRVVGLPGDRVEIRNGELVVNDIVNKEPYLPASFRDNDDHPPTEVRKALVYVLNNRRKHAFPGDRFPVGWVDPCRSAPWFDGWTHPPRRPCAPG